MSGDGHVQQRRAIEALRSGVPNRDAVQALGSSQIRIQDSFVELLDRLGAVSDGAKAAAGDHGISPVSINEIPQLIAGVGAVG